MATAMRSQCNLQCGSARRNAAASHVVLPRISSCSLRLSQKPHAFGCSSASVVTRQSRPLLARASPAAAQASSSSVPETKEWYALVASADFFFNDPQNESLAEQLRERVRFFNEQNKPRDFYFVPEPKWLDVKYREQAKKVKRPCVALVSTDKNWIVFMKLRLDRVMRFDMGVVPDAEVLAVGAQLDKEDFKGPAKWTAPYPRYSAGWWEVFYPGN